MAKTYFADFENSRFISTSGDIVEPSITFYRGSEYSFVAKVAQNYETSTFSNTAINTFVDLSGNTDFACYIGRYYGISAMPVVSSTSFNTDISALSAGILEFSFDASVSALATDMNTLYSQDYEIEIWSRSGVNNVLILQSPVTIGNIAVDPPTI